VQVELPGSDGATVSRLRAAGLQAELRAGLAIVRAPADGDALDRALQLLELPPLPEGGALAVLAALEAAPDVGRRLPELSLPLRVQPSKATALGWSAEVFSLTVLISNVALRKSDGALLPTERGPVVAVCAEYDRPLTSLSPPSVADYATARARALGVPMLRLPTGGFLRKPLLRLEATAATSRTPASRPDAIARAEQFFGELASAWRHEISPALQVAWPVFRPAREGPLLDGVGGAPLPEMELR